MLKHPEQTLVTILLSYITAKCTLATTLQHAKTAPKALQPHNMLTIHIASRKSISDQLNEPKM